MKRKFESDDPNGCNDFYGAACNFGKSAGVGSGFVWPNKASKEASLNGTLKSKFYNNVAMKGDWVLGALLAQLIMDAEIDAENSCGGEYNCCDISISVRLDAGDFYYDNSMPTAQKDPLVAAAGSYKNKYDCKTKQFSEPNFRYQYFAIGGYPGVLP